MDPVGVDPIDMAITPDGSTAYVVNSSDGTLTPIPLATGAPGAPMTVGDPGYPCAIAATQDGTTAYVLSGGTNGDTLTPVALAEDPAQDAVERAISVARPIDATMIAITPDGHSAFIAGPDGASQVALPSGRLLWSTTQLGYTALAITPDGSTAVLAAPSTFQGPPGALTLVSVTDSAPIGSIPLDGQAVAVGFPSSAGSS